MPLGFVSISTAGKGYEYGLYTDVEVLNGSGGTYGTDTSNRAKATVLVGEDGTIVSCTVTSEGDYYSTNTNLQLVSDTGALEGDPTTKLNFNRTITKIVYSDPTTITTVSKTGSWSTNGSTITLGSTVSDTNIKAGMEIFSASLPEGTYYVSNSFVSTGINGAVIPIVDAFNVSKTITQTGQSNHALSFRENYITIPSGSNLKGIVKGMSISGPTQFPSGTVVSFAYTAKKSGDTGYSGPVNVPISRKPSALINNVSTTFSSSAIGSQATITTAQTKLDSSTFTLNGFLNANTGYCVLYRNAVNGIDFIALFFNSNGYLVDCISNLKIDDVIHLSRDQMFAQAL